jgi:hypothetical protein
VHFGSAGDYLAEVSITFDQFGLSAADLIGGDKTAAMATPTEALPRSSSFEDFAVAHT